MNRIFSISPVEIIKSQCQQIREGITMKLITRCTSIFCVLLLLGIFQETRAQDTLDVAQGAETLNLAVESDTTVPGGEPLNLNRVYRLERGGVYLLNGAVRNVKSSHLRIVAASGDEPAPILIPMTDEGGKSKRAFRLYGDGTFKGLYVSGINTLGNQTEKNMFRCDAEGLRIVIDDCFLDHDAQSFVRLNAEEQKLYMTNTQARNSVNLASTGNGRIIDTRGNTTDSIFVQNCTFYHWISDLIRDGGGIIKNLVVDHNTSYGGGGEIESFRAVNSQITNNLFINIDFEGDVLSKINPADTVIADFVDIDSLGAPELASEAERTFKYLNNNFAMTPKLQAWFDTIDTVYAWVWLNQETEAFVDTGTDASVTFENIISEDPEFADAPPESLVTVFSQYRRDTNFSDENNPDFRADRNGIASISGDPNSFGPAEDEYGFDYPSSKVSYTAAGGGFPLGDLNWFPDKKAEWEAAGKPTVDVRVDAYSVPTEFQLSQNFPNPFNPTTSISYSLRKPSQVTLTIYTILGQKIHSLIDNELRPAGSYTIKWNGRDDSGRLVASGVYLYSLEAGEFTQARKMLLVR